MTLKEKTEALSNLFSLLDVIDSDDKKFIEGIIVGYSIANERSKI